MLYPLPPPSPPFHPYYVLSSLVLLPPSPPIPIPPTSPRRTLSVCAVPQRSTLVWNVLIHPVRCSTGTKSPPWFHFSPTPCQRSTWLDAFQASDARCPPFLLFCDDR